MSEKAPLFEVVMVTTEKGLFTDDSVQGPAQHWELRAETTTTGRFGRDALLQYLKRRVLPDAEPVLREEDGKFFILFVREGGSYGNRRELDLTIPVYDHEWEKPELEGVPAHGSFDFVKVAITVIWE